MPAYSYSFRPWAFRPISFSSDRMQTIGLAAVASSRARIMSGLNVMDAPARPLTPGYAKRKVRAGQQPIRNWRLTGQLLDTMGVLAVQQNSVSFGFSLPDATKLHNLAAWNSNIEKMAGLSPRDRANVNTVLLSEFSAEIVSHNK